MKVHVEVITGTFIDLEVNEDATVKELKEKIATDLKLPANRLILVVGDEAERRILMKNEDEKMLRDVGVCQDSHVYLFFMHLDLVYKYERSREGDDASMEEISSNAESSRRNQEEEKVNIDGEEEEKEMQNEEEDREGNVKEEKENNGEEEAKEVEEGDKKEEA